MKEAIDAIIPTFPLETSIFFKELYLKTLFRTTYLEKT